jgi:hypothetical protein
MKIKTLQTLLLGCLAAVSIYMPSCQTTLQASLDESNEKEGGASGYSTGSQVGQNLSLLWMYGLSEGANRSNSSNRGNELDSMSWDPWNKPFADHSAAGGGIVLSPMFEFVSKGCKAFGASSHENYLEGAADVMYRYTMANGGSVFAGLGPWIAYGIGGKTGNGANKEPTFGGDDGIKRFDAGLNLKGGYAFANSLEFNISYDLGLVNRSPAPDWTTKSRSFSLNVGYSVDKIIGAIRGH